ncbi:galactose mutarotase-like protein [Anaeromyces robustus]|jgi:glucose-6-phosphate 1-epimerase|uniref:glucose-6-phosphate 1-epimerase n=1 Tax=Anaeromyces robustus TaxID=1754192 RepID=A0A1Y1WQY5_9FUNG|nr:galactose mutarotase-like protein [Anaeromyces robustus]|eukprot:ORX75941.1 galactose mutarotase-like protein [Anaeromyces robustus]
MKFNLLLLVLASGLVSAKKVCHVKPNDNTDISVGGDNVNNDNIISKVIDSQYFEEPTEVPTDEPTDLLENEENSGSENDVDDGICCADGTCKDLDDYLTQCENKLNGVEFIKDSEDNLKIIKITTSTASVEIYRFGATLTSWIVDGEERIFLSKKAVLDGTGPIRGGIPLVFPQFKADLTEDLPFHGFARISNWRLGAIDATSEDRKEISFILTNDEVNEEYLKIWPHQFELVYTVTLDGKSLKTNMKITNTGDDKFLFNTLLHTYYNVKDLTKAGVYGLLGNTYIDTTPEGNYERKVEDRERVPIVKETDYIYVDVNQNLFKAQTGFENDINIEKYTFQDVIIYNPWIAKSRTLEDLGEEGYPHMLCVEVGRVSQPIELEAGSVYEGGQTITVE